ncbi:MAG: citrate/2-methylcitrate synthase [Chloroflexota bacterium]|nr:citrate synthase [Anaerolineae bacterium]
MARVKKHIKSPGLAGVIVADSELSYIDGLAGILRYRGYNISDLAQHATYEEVVHLLWFGELPNREQLEALKIRLIGERTIHHGVLTLMSAFPTWPEPIEVLRTAVSALSSYDSESEVNSPDANLRKAIRLVAKMPTIVASYCRLRDGKYPLSPDPTLGHAANFLYMVSGEKPSALKEQAMNMAMVSMSDHGLNASTFAARVIASTLSDMYSAVTGAIGALKGPLHGAANRGSMEMMLEIGDVTRVEEYVEGALISGKKIMGFGHRVYKTMDPRAINLKAMVEALSQNDSYAKWGRLALRINEVVTTQKGLNPNVDFYSGAMMYLLGLSLDVFTPIFACSRVAGWTAQIMEQYNNNRLIRPLATYIGPEEREYIPLDER